MRRPRTMALAAILFTLLAAPGCGPNLKDRGTVKGRLTFNGEPVPGATIAFVTDDNLQGSGHTDENGDYEVRDAPVGKTRVFINAPKARPGIAMSGGVKPPEVPKGSGPMKPPDGEKFPQPEDKPPPKIDPAKVKPIPQKYELPETSGLTFTVEKGTQTFDIKLTP